MATSPLRPRGGRYLSLGLAAALGVAAFAAHAGPADVYYERVLMHAADQRCHLFTPEISAALAASGLQARGAAFRAGASERDIAGVAGRAEAVVARAGCGPGELRQAAERVRTAFAGYARMTAMRFPGERSAWAADRDPIAPVVDHRAAAGPRWRLSEAGDWAGGGSGPVLLGLAGDNASPAVVSGARDGAQASGAFLTVRDPEKSDTPYLDPYRHDLAGRAPPASITRTFAAAARNTAPASLLPGASGMVFAFPSTVVRALEALDPREVVTVDFAYPGRPSERAVFEVGDFAAGRAFLLAGR